MSNSDRAFFGHPIGLAILFFTEMWERFSYYGMRALLVLYIASSTGDGGLGWTNSEALALYGWYTMLVYVMSIPGGIIADKFLGQKRTVMLGGLALCIGHGILAIDELWAFYSGLAFIILGVGGLKPNISVMVGGLYKQGDARRDKGFTLFYIGINTGSFLASLIVGYVGEKIGWHYGFGLAGIGMILGQLVFIAGQKYLKGVGDFVKEEKYSIDTEKRVNHLTKLFARPVSGLLVLALMALGVYVGLNSQIGYGIMILMIAPLLGIGINIYQDELNSIEKDRVVVLLLSFLIVIVFWGAFEQAGGLMSLYTKDKIDRMFFGWEIPASVFQSVNSFFIITCGTIVAVYWALRKRKGKESSSLFKMAVGTIIMGLGFLMMGMASVEATQPFSKAAMIWLILAYFLHTIGELSSSPVSLSFITKLAPAKYVSIIMGIYWAATGFGNKLAGAIGESSQTEPVKVELQANEEQLKTYVTAVEAIREDKEFSFKTTIYYDGTGFQLADLEKHRDLKPFIKMDEESRKRLIETLKEENTSKENQYHATLEFSKDEEAVKVKKNKGDGKDYKGSIIVYEVQNTLEFNTFIFITLFTVGFGILLLLFLKKLKKLTHGVEEQERDLDEVAA